MTFTGDPMKLNLLLTMALWAAAAPAQESAPRGYEQEVVYHLVERYGGEIAWIDAGGRDFLGLFREAARGYSRRAAIILHDMGAHADWPDVVHPLRTTLPAHGWATLSIQLPILAPDVPHSEYGRTFRGARQRILAALRHLEAAGYERVALVGYSFGAAAALDFLKEHPAAVDAFVGISMQDHRFLDPPSELTKQLAALAVPALDIYGGSDFSSVVRSVDDRRLAGGGVGRPPYEQRVVEGADHYYTGTGGELAEAIGAWLETAVPDDKPVKLDEIYYF